MNQRNYRILSKIFKIFTIIWVYFFGVVIILSIIGFFLTSTSFIDGWQKVSEIFSPFNIANLIVTIIFLSPALVSYTLYEYFEKNIKNSNNK